MNYEAKYTASRALIIGIDAYTNCAPLSNARHDAESVATALVAELGFSQSEIRILLNSDATKSNILSAFNALHQSTNPDDRVIVFFAGHGHSVSGNTKTQGYLVPVDADPGDLSSLVRWQEFIEGSEIIPAKHILFVMDACFSGLMMQRSVAGSQNRFITDMLQRYSRQAITAGKADQTVGDGAPGGNSTFTHHFLEGLRGAASDKSGVITATSAMNYAYRRVSQDASSDQTPHYGHLQGEGDMILKLPDSTPIDETTTGDFLAEVIAEVPEPFEQTQPTENLSSYFRSSNLEEATDSNFGINQRTSRLCQSYYLDNENRFEAAKKFMVVSVAPIGKLPSKPRLTEVFENLRRRNDGLNEPPFWKLLLPQEMRTTLTSILAYNSNHENKDLKNQILSLDDRGRIEFSVADNVMQNWSPRNRRGQESLTEASPSYPCWDYVGMVGTLWCFLELARQIYIELAYESGLSIRVALVGTKEGHLVGFATGEGKERKRWIEPLSTEGAMQRAFGSRTCEDSNILLSYQATQRNLSGEGAKVIIDDFARKLALAFNHQGDGLPCFNWGTDVFPWRQFVNHWRQYT